MSELIRFNHVLLLLLLPLAAVEAQELLAEEEPEIRRYTVEMIIFKYAQDVGIGTETFIGEELPLDESLLIDGTPPIDSETAAPGESSDEPAEGIDEETVVVRDTEFVLLDDEELTMGEIMGHLRRLDVYDPVMYFGWTQATWPEEETQSIELASLATPPPGLDGTLKLYLSRFLHLVVDLELDAPGTITAPPSTDEPYASYGDVAAMGRFGSTEPRRGPVRYRIQEDRIFRSGELRYFDHPKFGVLARITRIEEEEQAQEESELLGYPPE